MCLKATLENFKYAPFTSQGALVCIRSSEQHKGTRRSVGCYFQMLYLDVTSTFGQSIGVFTPEQDDDKTFL